MKYLLICILFLCHLLVNGQSDPHTISLNDSVKLILIRDIFSKHDHNIEFINDADLIIDNEIVFGTDGDIPRFSLKEAKLTINDKDIDLEISSMYNPWFGIKPNQNSFEMIQDGTHIKIRGFFSDGAGSYGVEWLIIGERSVRTILTYDEQILFEYFKY
jgi:hypothetical protein